VTSTQAGADHGRHHWRRTTADALLEGKVDHVIGVDTHRDSHTAAVPDPNGGLVAQLEIPSDQAGAQSLLGLVAQRARGRRCWAVEGAGCYGAGLASFLADRGEWWSRSTGPSGPAAGPAPRATCWTPSGPPGKR
jgi:transposase